MTRFQWRGRHGDGRSVSGEMQADSQEQVMAFLRAQAIQVESLTVSFDDSGSPGARTLRLALVATFLIVALLIFAVPYLTVMLRSR